jgi:macrodomain Ter protein organizer (MatP/YcbG family)
MKMTKPSTKKKFSVSLDREDYDKLKEFADKERRNVSNAIAYLISQMIEEDK